ncbi:lantibiotic dehydratase [Smaragdicoccus niigatensis]|uniref:lantibiotic dehydratase n=1 Tax=Smaragdicoccus niigatensis TaxID=359359 RepID=UPI00035F5E7A|nr:lantibiotic dehydratase [Smaragdicoccus niigatensis]
MRQLLTASQFFVMRAPLLPLEELEGLRTDPTYWRTLVSRPAVREALYLASPGLMRRVAAGEPDDRMIASVTAYLVRMCTRSTPFGLFAGCSLGVTGDETALAVDGPEGTNRHSRPDTEVLTLLVERLIADASTRPLMEVEPNSSRYHTAGGLRLIESRLRDGRRTHHLVVVEEDTALQCALEAAADGCLVEKVVDAVMRHAEVDVDEARDYVDALIDAKVLTPVAEPAVTGPEPLTHVLASLRENGFTETTEALERISNELADLDAAGIGNPIEVYEAPTATLLELAGGGDDARLIQVDLHRAGSGLTLGPDTMRRLTEGAELLHRVSPRREDAALARFTTEFAARYESREVPLMEALDEEMGVGFDRSAHPAADESPLLAGIDLGGDAAESSFTARDSVLLDLLIRTLASDTGRLELDPPTVARLETAESSLPLPDAFAVFANLLDDAVEIEGVRGPSGAELLGRFCHGDPRLAEAVKSHLRAEETLAPGVVFPEIIHLPEGRVGNVLARPVLRDYELILLGRSGAPADHQISVDELTVRLDGDRVVLFSPRLNAEVRPRLTTAHNPAWRGFGVYRFLTALRNQGVAAWSSWDWGALSTSPTLPRVSAGDVVFARARWRLSAEEIGSVTGPEPMAGWSALARSRGVPRELLVVDNDNRLYVDTTSASLTAMAAKTLRGRKTAVLEEVLSSRVAVGPQGHFAHELIVPFVRRREPASLPRPNVHVEIRRSFAPGSEWLYLKIYTGTASADRILTDTMGPVIARLRESGVIDHWFFLRYADPEHHLRIRLHGNPSALQSEALPALTDALAPRLDDRTVWNVVVDTYHREVERYGGDAGIALAEQIHGVDSDAEVQVLGMLEGDEAADARWKLCLYATDRLLADAGFDLPARREWARTGAAGYRTEYPEAPNLDPSIGQRWRVERADLTRLLDDATPHPYEAGREVFRQRSARLAPLLAELSERARSGLLTAPFQDIVRSFSHLNAIRLLRSAARTHELVLLNFLDRHYGSLIARTRVSP